MRPKPRSRRPAGIRPRFRPGLALRRDPRLWWLLVLSVALTAGWIASSVVSRADRARHAWGASDAVLVAERDLQPGDEVGAHDVSLERRPATMVPATALHELPAGAVVHERVLTGEVLVTERLAAAGLSGLAATLPAGTRAVAVPVEPGMAPPLAVGDQVDVLVALPAETAGDGPPGFAVATDALVVAVDDASVTVAVARSVAPRIAVALGQGAVLLALVGA
jgi:Flp pilus assembly protein CpaB